MRPYYFSSAAKPQHDKQAANGFGFDSIRFKPKTFDRFWNKTFRFDSISIWAENRTEPIDKKHCLWRTVCPDCRKSHWRLMPGRALSSKTSWASPPIGSAMTGNKRWWFLVSTACPAHTPVRTWLLGWFRCYRSTTWARSFSPLRATTHRICVRCVLF